jgi:methenyltetrahydromethanopterin cyclohydrolase
LPRNSQAEEPSLLLAAISARALAQSARRAGLTPLVADFFADTDTQDAAHACRKLAGGMDKGLRARPLLHALEALAGLAPSPLLGFVYGAGFEGRPELLTLIAKSWPLLGNDAATVKRLKAPEIFFAELDRLGIPHPLMASERPAKGGSWLAKKRGGAGGSHIVPSRLGRGSPNVYYQERVEGRAVSALFVGNGSGARVLGFSEQWTAPTPKSLWRYGGAVRPAALSPASAQRMASAVMRIARSFKIKGLASADFMVRDGEALLLEINPRPGATLDIFDCGATPLLRLHVEAVRKGKLPPSGLKFEDAMASAIVYADHGGAAPSGFVWPEWSADRPKSSERIDKNRPICTVWARAGTKARAKRLIKERICKILAGFQSVSRGITVNKREEIAAARQTTWPSVNAKAEPLVKALIDDADALRIDVTRGKLGECRIDCGVRAVGGLEAGRRIAEICLGGLGRVALETTDTESSWPFVVTVHTSQPVLACLGSQYAGWSLSAEDNGKKYSVLGSGPARAIGSSEKLFDELDYRDKAASAVLVLEADRPPPRALVEEVAKACKLKPDRLTFIYAPTSSLAGTVQIAARCLEVALHKAHELHFPLDHIVDGIATAPLPPPAPDFVAAMGRTNDAIIYGGRAQLFVSSGAKEAKGLADNLPSLKSKDYGKPFADIFAAVKGDFYAIDRMLFSPAMVTVTSLKTGESFEGGRIDTAVLSRSFA